MLLERSSIVAVVLTAAISIAGQSVQAQTASQPDKLADPKPTSQAGFPADLYKWSTPAGGEPTPARVALGKALFFDSRLSADGKEDCATCHSPDKGFTDQLPTSMGIHNQFGQRNAPTILNSMFYTTLFWDGRAATLEDQIQGPITNPVEMGNANLDDVVARVRAIPEYKKQFNDVFGRDPAYSDMTHAIAAYERTQILFDSPFDHFIAGDQNAISDSAKRGWSLFNGKGRCMSCHGFNPTQPLFTDFKFHNIGVSAHKSDFVPQARKALAIIEQSGGGYEQIDQLAIQSDLSGLGRFLVTKQPHDI
ncbi:MAG TPA: cytochrome-c peroxidase, partial [Candidatus Binataceae bacterium]